MLTYKEFEVYYYMVYIISSSRSLNEVELKHYIKTVISGGAGMG